jgi:hypothetical protein
MYRLRQGQWSFAKLLSSEQVMLCNKSVHLLHIFVNVTVEVGRFLLATTGDVGNQSHCRLVVHCTHYIVAEQVRKSASLGIFLKPDRQSGANSHCHLAAMKQAVSYPRHKAQQQSAPVQLSYRHTRDARGYQPSTALPTSTRHLPKLFLW